MSGIAILCSGQGTQSADMFDLLKDAPEAAGVFAAATVHLGGVDPRDIAGTDESHGNRVGQILCCTQAMAAWAVFGPALRDIELVVAGYSVGELAAWGIAGLLDADAILDLAMARAKAMDAATPAPSGLAALGGLPRAAVDAICDGQEAHVAIVNGADRFIVGGTREALSHVIEAAEAKGAQRASLLQVAVASHTPLLADAVAPFRQALDARPLPERPIQGRRLLSGIDAAVVRATEAGRDKLARQIAEPIDWAGCMDACRSFGVETVLELGPGAALARMMQTIMPDARVRALSDFRTIDGVKRWLEAD